jgi:hypothetical protein
MIESGCIKKIIIDESIPENQVENIVSLLKRKRINYSDFCFIAKEHKGMPDYQILHFLLNDATVLFTCDRPFHNTVLKKGYKSFYYNGEVFSSEWLKGISPIKMPAHIRKDLSPQDSYHETWSGIRNLVLPKSEKGLKRLRTKRRRIKSYFGSTENMESVAITVSYMSFDSSMLVGIRIKISSNTGIEALDASESYISEKIETGNREIIAICHGLVASIQMMLNNVETVIYYEARLNTLSGIIQKNTEQPSILY